MTPYEQGKVFAQYCIEEGFPSLDYPVDDGCAVYNNSLEYASSFAKDVSDNMHKMNAEAQEFARGFLKKFD